MSKLPVAGVIIGFVFTIVIVAGAAVSALPEGGTVLLAAVVDGLLAGICIGVLIGANFALAAVEQAETKHQAQEPGSGAGGSGGSARFRRALPHFGQLFLEVFTSKSVIRRPILVLAHLGHLILPLLRSYSVNDRITSKFFPHLLQRNW
jgi:hypothetical protein